MSTSLTANKFSWLVKREFWEYRGSFFWAPIITAMVVIAFALFGLILTEVTAHQHGISVSGFDITKITAAMGADDVEKLHSALDISLLSMSFPIGIVLFFVLFFYCTGTLYNERADRSLLFWKSLPFSDVESVLAKLFAVAVVAPVLAVAGMIALQLSFLVLLSLYALFHGINALPLLWSPTHLTSLWFKLIVRIPVNSLWALPSVGWLFLCSSFVRSKPFLWAVMLPVVSGVLVSMLKLMQSLSLESAWYWRHIVGRLLLSLIPGSWMWMDFGPTNLAHLGNNPLEMADNFLSLSALANELTSPDMWIGAVAGAAMIVAAIYFRRTRFEAYA